MTGLDSNTNFLHIPSVDRRTVFIRIRIGTKGSIKDKSFKFEFRHVNKLFRTCCIPTSSLGGEARGVILLNAPLDALLEFVSFSSLSSMPSCRQRHLSYNTLYKKSYFNSRGYSAIAVIPQLWYNTAFAVYVKYV